MKPINICVSIYLQDGPTRLIAPSFLPSNDHYDGASVDCCLLLRPRRGCYIIGKQSFFLSGALGHGVGGMIDREQNWLALMEWFVFVWGVSRLHYSGSRRAHWMCCARTFTKFSRVWSIRCDTNKVSFGRICLFIWWAQPIMKWN